MAMSLSKKMLFSLVKIATKFVCLHKYIYILETIMPRRGLFLESVDQVKIMLNAGKMYSESPRTIWYRIWEITHLIWKLSSMDSLVATFDYFWSFAAYYCALSTLKGHEEKLIFGNQNCTGVRIVLAKPYILCWGLSVRT